MKKNFLKTVSLILSFMLLFCFLTSCKKETEEKKDKEFTHLDVTANTQFTNNLNKANPIATMTVKDYGVIKIELYKDVAPNTVANFISLAKSGFYDGLIFHRVINNFMIQGGCPDRNGFGDPGYSIKGEFSNNNIENSLSHTDGVISMARSTPPDSAGSQFFICNADASQLDGDYAAFGKVIEGLEIVHEISNVSTDGGDRPFVDVVIESIVIDEKGGDYSYVEKIGGNDTPALSEDALEQKENNTDKENPIATLTIKDYGVIKIELYKDIAPNTVANFISLANDGFYDGLIFHRIINNFMMQGGCPDGKGTGNPGYSIKGEFSNNGIKNDLSHTDGVVSMARSTLPDSAGSQFFICNADSTFLDGQYAAFGKVIEGLDIVHEISTVKTDTSDKPLNDVVIESLVVDVKGGVYTHVDKIS